jgi:hypothetical protein
MLNNLLKTLTDLALFKMQKLILNKKCLLNVEVKSSLLFLYTSPNIRVIKSRRMKWVGHAWER